MLTEMKNRFLGNLKAIKGILDLLPKKGFIENAANENGIPDIKELNQQTQMALLVKHHLGEMLSKTETRSAMGDQLILLMGLTGTVATGIGAPMMGALAVVGGREIARLPRVRTFMSNRMRLLADGEYKELLRGIQTGKKSKEFFKIVRREKANLHKMFPELKAAGFAQQYIPESNPEYDELLKGIPIKEEQ